MQQLTCKKCGAIDIPSIVANGPHMEAKCLHCESHIKFLSKKENEKDFTFRFGKYKHQLFSEVLKKDLPYVLWVHSAQACRGWQHDILENRLEGMDLI